MCTYEKIHLPHAGQDLNTHAHIPSPHITHKQVHTCANGKYTHAPHTHCQHVAPTIVSVGKARAASRSPECTSSPALLQAGPLSTVQAWRVGPAFPTMPPVPAWPPWISQGHCLILKTSLGHPQPQKPLPPPQIRVKPELRSCFHTGVGGRGLSARSLSSELRKQTCLTCLAPLLRVKINSIVVFFISYYLLSIFYFAFKLFIL